MTSLGIQIPHCFKQLLEIVIVIIHSSCGYRAATIPVDRLHHFMSYLLIIFYEIDALFLDQ